MTDREEALYALTASDGWKYVDEVAEEELRSLQSIAEIQATGEAQALQVEIRSRQLAAQTVRSIFQKVRSYGDGAPTTPLNRSMR